MADRGGYIGRNPGDAAVTVAREVFTPGGITTSFTFAAGYTVGYMDVFLNGVKLVEARDYEAGNGTSVGLSSYAQSGDILELVAYKAFNMGQSIDQITGNLSLGGKLTVSGVGSFGDIVSSGIVTADSFSGSGSGLTGLPGQADFWIKTAAGINTTVSVGIGTTRPDSISRVNNTSITNVGILTAYQIYGDGSNLSGISTAAVPGISTQLHSVFGTVNASGIVTASAFYGSGANLTNIDTGVAGVNTTGFSTFRDVKHAGISTFVGIVSCSDVVSSGIVTADGFSAGGRTVVGVYTGFSKQQTYYTWGPHTWTKHPDISKIRVIVTGGGGGGHGQAPGSKGGSGGGGGGTAIKVIYAPALSATEAVTVGSAGTAKNSSTDQANPGGTSSFGSHCSATGGGGGICHTSPASYGGVGGDGTGGDLNLGGQGANMPTTGIDEAGSTGGSSYWGGGGRGSRTDPTHAHGQSGSYGAGGGGANSSGNAGTGGLGVVVVEEYF